MYSSTTPLRGSAAERRFHAPAAPAEHEPGASGGFVLARLRPKRETGAYGGLVLRGARRKRETGAPAPWLHRPEQLPAGLWPVASNPLPAA
jgi:hypothetical protein